jgi:nitrite reductase/ring-hydroxylating ferredoxin subunit
MSSSEENEDRFVRVAELRDVPVGGGKVVKKRGKQVALVRVDEARIYAIDNRCPHEGYPLVEGTVKDCVLTCDWHNWKFDLSSGECLRGGEDVRAYPLELRGSSVWLDLSDGDPAALRPVVQKSFEDAVAERDMGRAARDVLRLLELGVTPEELITKAAIYAADRLEWGWDHGLTVAAECVRALPLYKGAEVVIPVTQAVAGATDRALRRPVRQKPAPIAVEGGLEEARRRFLDLLEAEEHAAAEAVFTGALASGMGPEETKRWLFPAATEHFLSYGHGLIYTVRAIQMLERVGWARAADLLPALVFQIAWGTREDRLPYMRRFQAMFRAIEPELPGLFELQARGGGADNGAWDEGALFTKILDGSIEEGFKAVHEALRAGVPASRILDVISAASGERLLRFDARIDRDPQREEGWLDVTHLITHTHAAREAFAMCPGPETLRAVFYSARFVHYVRNLDRPVAEGQARAPLPEAEGQDAPEDELLTRIEEAIKDFDGTRAVALTRGYLAAGHREAALGERLTRYAIADSASAEIMIAHTIKTTVAAFEELAVIQGPRRALPVLATVRFLAAPKRERFVYPATLRALSMLAE